ncbi:hypothetical protein [Streptomyces albogriseolus]|uniref:hypothetical protein n=1 Tax=Streptomyces albogriseolus TaxID=1887 RepID=UPI003CFADB37
MPRNPVEPTHVYQPMAQHMPVEYYRPQPPVCQCGGHAPVQPQQPVQQIIVKQTDPFARYLGLGFAAAAIGLMVVASLVITLVMLVLRPVPGGAGVGGPADDPAEEGMRDRVECVPRGR